ncbi:MAG: carbamoyltransferase HypF, partial [Bacteroidota bacterium]
LEAGKIIAVKGIGGYLLMCDASNPNSVSELRMRKNRPHKPFALLYPDADTIKRDCELTEEEVQSLKSPEAPIVLLKRKGGVSSIAHQLISPGLDSVGVMLPYAPLLGLIAQEFGDALVATSANVSGSSILYKDEDALKLLETIADVVLTNNREIVAPQDDSVVSYSGDRPLLLRRSRGFAPSYFGSLPANAEKGWLAMGAHMKGSVAFSCGNIWHISQYLGSLDSFESQATYKHTLSHLTQLIDFQTRGILTDAHPGYFVNQLAHEYADALEVPLVQIQHHEAHFASVLQENDLLEGSHKVLGVIWDGTGYGTDGHIWGGEFFIYQNDEIDRITHFGYVANLASDKMAREPRISALAFLSTIPGLEEILKEKFSIEEWRVYQRLIATSNVMTSSVGRLFDAVASIIGLIDQTTYEGQAAMLLEQCARKCQTKDVSGYKIEVSAGKIDTSSLFIEMLRDLNEDVDKATIALKFHIALVELIRSVAHHYDQKQLAFSGGVFQNALLVELIDQRLGHEFELYFHKELSPNDENISFGQLAHYHIQLRSLNNLKTEENYVFSNSR